MLSVIVPTYNEKSNIRSLLQRTLQAFSSLTEEAELLVVDDASPDGTAEEVRAVAGELGETARVRVLVRTEDKGLAKAVMAGFEAAKGDVLAVMDADLSHPPELLTDMLAAIRNQGADLAVASRYVQGGGTQDWPLRRRFISRFACLLARPLTPVRDATSGYFSLRRECLQGVELRPIGYKIGLEVFVRSACSSAVEVPFVFRDRERGQSKLGGSVIASYLVQLASLYRARFPRLVGYVQFAAVGLLGMAVDACVFATTYWALGLAALGASQGGFLAQTASFLAAGSFNFALNARWTFRERAQGARLSAFLAVCAGGFVLRSLVFEGIVRQAGLLPTGRWIGTLVPLEQVALFAGIIAGSFWNFFGSLRWAFPAASTAGPEDPSDARARRRFLLLLAVFALLRVTFGSLVGLAADEAYYWQWSRHLAWGYYDHPPMVAYLIAGGTALLGTSELGVRLASLVLSVLTAALLYHLARAYWGSARAGLWAVGAALTTPLFAAGGLIATPDTPLVFFWTASVALALRALATERAGDWLLLGAAVGLGLLSKYPMVLLLPSLLCALAATHRGRVALRRPEPYLALVVAVTLCLPMLRWNLDHGMGSVIYQLRHGLGPAAGAKKAATGLETALDFLGGQLGVAGPLLFGFLVWVLARATRRLALGRTAGRPKPAGSPALSQDEMLPFLLCPALAVFLVFGVASLLARSEPNWTAPAYATGFVLLGGELARLAAGPRRGAKILLWVAVALGAVVSLYAHLEAAFPLVPYSKGPILKVRDRTELARWADRLRTERGEGRRAPVLAESYQLASLLAFYLPDHPDTDSPFEKGSGSAYLEWRRLPIEGERAWYFTADRTDRKARRLFREAELVGSHDDRRLGVTLDTVRAYYGLRQPEVLAPVGGAVHR